MRSSVIKRRSSGSLVFNATPLIDVIFILTIFFMLVSKFSSEELIPMQLPKPDASQAKAVAVPDRVVVNCRLANFDESGEWGSSGESKSTIAYSLGPNRPEPLALITDRLRAMKAQSPDLKVIIRADRRLPYANVRAVMEVLATLEIEMLNVVAHVSEGVSR